MQFFTPPVHLYRRAELLCGLVIAACGAVLMAVATHPLLAAIPPDSMATEVVYAEFALMACVIAAGAMLHARGHGRVARNGLWLATALWWAATAIFFDLSPVFGIMGMVASLACVSSMASARPERARPTSVLRAS